ncbi:sigma factor [Mycetocola zhadangensis]|uniref:sigma factor n=1 Tax=Mycetocola zhadangensis TaxID=1164595 RepID=UPI00280584B0|nr:sigma factor [Mycetocola zhadangensis]
MRGLESLQPSARSAAPPVGYLIDAQDALTRAHRDEWARVVATTARRFGNLDTAEDAAAEAFAIATERWPVDGIPPNPGAWLTTTASRKAIDGIRRESSREGPVSRNLPVSKP